MLTWLQINRYRVSRKEWTPLKVAIGNWEVIPGLVEGTKIWEVQGGLQLGWAFCHSHTLLIWENLGVSMAHLAPNSASPACCMELFPTLVRTGTINNHSPSFAHKAFGAKAKNLWFALTVISKLIIGLKLGVILHNLGNKWKILHLLTKKWRKIRKKLKRAIIELLIQI